jgi:tetratricopeptide (TPR) repeat protein
LLKNPDHLTGEQVYSKVTEILEENGVDLHAPLPPAEIVAQWKDSPQKPAWEIGCYALALANLKEWDRALEVANSITDDAERYERLSSIALCLMWNGLLDRAEAIVKSVPIESGHSEKIYALTNLAARLRDIGEIDRAIALLLEEAEPTARVQSDDCLSKADRFLEIALELAKTGMYDDAFRLLKEAIPIATNDYLRYRPNVEARKVLYYIPVPLIEVGEYDKAEELVKLLPEQFQKSAFAEIEKRKQAPE